MKEKPLLARTRAHLAEPLFRGAYSLMANTFATAVLGLVFWIVAARLFPTATVGRDSALVASMVLFSIWLRQRGSSQSKPVGQPHADTAVEG